MNALRFEGVVKSYGALEVLRGITAAFQPGRVAVLVGPNGAGKTTLMRIAARLQSADEGTVDGPHALFFGGCETLPVRSTVNALRAALRLPADEALGKRRLAKLSKGLLQQAGLRIAIETGADALLLDEPWTSLEPDARTRLNDEVRAQASLGRILVCSTHDLDQGARVADDVVLLREGRLAWHRREDLPADLTHQFLLDLYRGTSA